MKYFLSHLKFDNSFVDNLPADPNLENSSRQVLNACYSLVTPLKVASPELIIYSPEVADMLGINSADCESQQFADLCTGNALLPSMVSYASCYGGHQFGQWAGQLGDGRAINLGEVINSQNQRCAIQLKGAGPTPYSRHADGLAVLRSSVREFLCSEAMFHLGVPTTRALSLCLTGDLVPRDMFYDGHVKEEPGAVVCRVSPSFTRFGHFQILAAQGQSDNNKSLLKKLVDYTITTDFAHLGKPCQKVYCQWFNEVCRLTKEMVIHWMRVGFVHGVMNTDNMSILGLTIDYGPYGWLEGYDEDWTPNTTDSAGKRYCFGRQAVIAHWNLLQLAQSIAALLDDLAPLKLSLDQFCTEYETEYQQMMLDKLGLGGISEKDDSQLVEDLLKVLQLTETDMTIFFRKLSELDVKQIAENNISQIPNVLFDAYYHELPLSDEISTQICQWINQYARRVLLEFEKDIDPLLSGKRKSQMNQVNPKFVLRNYLAQQAIEQSESGDHRLLHELLDVMRKPYDDQLGKEKFAEKRPEWARHKAGCSMLSCSS